MLPFSFILSNSEKLSLYFKNFFRFNIPSETSKYAYLILFSERYSFAGSQSGQNLLPNTSIFFIKTHSYFLFIKPVFSASSTICCIYSQRSSEDFSTGDILLYIFSFSTLYFFQVPPPL